MTTTRPLTGPLLKSGSRIPPRGEEWVRERLGTYDVKRIAIYVDHTSLEKDIPALEGIAGCYTFDANLEGKTFLGRSIGLLGLGAPMPDCDGWLVASTSRASAFTLAKALLEAGTPGRIITRLYGGQTTLISAYMDFLSGETETLVYVNHYFDRVFRINFPLDMRYQVCRCDGTPVRSGQLIIPPGGIRTFDSREVDLGEFEGFVRVEMEVENLQSRVQPFIHFWADYLSEAGVCRNHQSGWSPWPSDTVFNRGYLPLDPDLEAVACFYNENPMEVRPRVLLHYTAAGEEHAVERRAAPVGPGCMSYQNVSELFADVDLSGAKAAYVLLSCDKPLHRPNYYIARKGTHQFVDTFHQTGGKACHWSTPSYFLDESRLDICRRHGFDPWVIRIPVLPASFGLETFYGLLSPTLSDNRACIHEVLDHEGRPIHEERVELTGETPMFLNISRHVGEKGLDLSRGGYFCIKPDWHSASQVATSSVVLFGYKHPEALAPATSFKGAPAETNLPFYLTARLPNVREYDYSPLQQSNHFASGVVDGEFDSLIIVNNNPLKREGARTARYDLEIHDVEGTVRLVHRELGPNRFDTFWLSELVAEAGMDPSGRFFTVWIRCADVKLKPYHGIYRRADHALSLDDGSEGTLQREPMVEGLRYEDIEDDAGLLADLGIVRQ